MKQNFHICFVKPEGYQGSLVFREVLFLLRNSLQSLGYDCTMAGNSLEPDRTNIIVGYHLLGPGDYLKNVRYIPYQLEQLDRDNPWVNDGALDVLEGAETIWDFSNINIRFLKKQELTADLVPMGYHKSLEIVPQAEKKDIDVLFYGSINERRKKLLEDLSEKVKLHVVQGSFGEERDALIGRSKIVLNMHYYPTRILETVRISYLLNNGCFVISEDADDNPWPELGLVTAPYGKLIDTVTDWLSRSDDLDARRELNYEQFARHYAMTDILSKAIS